jgi:hypothetical protein
MIESCAGRPALLAGTFFNTASIAAALESFLNRFGMASSVALILHLNDPGRNPASHRDGATLYRRIAGRE